MTVAPVKPNTSFVLPLAAPDAALELVGGKGASLARLAAGGFPVPPGFHVTTAAYRRFVDENSLQGAVEEAAGQAVPGDPASLDRASAQIQALFAAAPMPGDVRSEIGASYAVLAAEDSAVAVRSSATAEDLPGMSFAGQQETYLNVQGESDLLDAVKRCWASLWTARAIGYRARHGIPPDRVSLAVVVQRLVPAEAAGVLFTANPVTGSRDEMVINAAWGLGEAVVGGLVTPDTITARKAGGAVIAEQIADKETMTVLAAGGTAQTPVPDGLRRTPALYSADVAELVRLGREVEQAFGMPQDIEWAMHGGRVYLLQARPITALPEGELPPHEGVAPAARLPRPGQNGSLDWSPLRPGGRYARSSVIELLPDPLTPLFATLALPEWNHAMAEFGRSLGVGDAMASYPLVTINDYAYYDFGLTTRQALGLISDFAPVIGRLPSFLGSAEERWAGEARPAYVEVVRRWEGQDAGSTPAAALLDGAREITRAAAHHYLTVQSGILPAAYMGETFFTAVYNRLIRGPGDPAALTFLLGYDSAPIRAEKSLYDLAGWVRGQEVLCGYLQSTPALELAWALHLSPGPYERPEGWEEFRRRFADHLARFGHAIYNLDFARAVPAGEPQPLLDTLKVFLRGEAASPYERQAAAAAARDRAVEGTMRRLRGWRLALFRRALGTAQRYAPLREDALADAGLGWPVLRRMLLEIGRRLVDANTLAAAEDVFFLHADEVDAAARALDDRRAPADHRRQLAERQARWEKERRVTPPPALPPKEGTRFLGFDFAAFLPARLDQAEGGTIRGIGTSPGRVTGAARVLDGPADFGQMRQGDILVARITTPAWTPLFVLAGGVVTDVGGPLSHSSIVAREYGIPAVLGTGVATERIRSGERISVDGSAGIVTLARPAGGREPSREPETAAPAQPVRLGPPKAASGLLAVFVLLLAVLFLRRRRRAPRAPGSA